MEFEQLTELAQKTGMSPIDACIEFILPHIPMEEYEAFVERIGLPENLEVWTFEDLEKCVRALDSQPWRAASPREVIGQQLHPHRQKQPLYMKLLSDRQWEACWTLYASVIESGKDTTLVPHEFGRILGIALSQKRAMLDVLKQEEREMVIQEVIGHFANRLSIAVLEKSQDWSMHGEIMEDGLMPDPRELNDGLTFGVTTFPTGPQRMLREELRKAIEEIIVNALS